MYANSQGNKKRGKMQHKMYSIKRYMVYDKSKATKINKNNKKNT